MYPYHQQRFYLAWLSEVCIREFIFQIWTHNTNTDYSISKYTFLPPQQSGYYLVPIGPANTSPILKVKADNYLTFIIKFCIIVHICYAVLSHFSRVQLCVTPWTAAHQAPLSLGFSRQEHWSGLPFPSPMQESEKWKWSHSVVSDRQRPHGLQPTRLLRPWDFPGRSTGVGCHCLLRIMHIYLPPMFQRNQTMNLKHLSMEHYGTLSRVSRSVVSDSLWPHRL